MYHPEELLRNEYIFSVVELLKYFCEDAPEYAVIAAGSLLGVGVHQGISFPVGKVNMLYLYPMSFAFGR